MHLTSYSVNFITYYDQVLNTNKGMADPRNQVSNILTVAVQRDKPKIVYCLRL